MVYHPYNELNPITELMLKKLFERKFKTDLQITVSNDIALFEKNAFELNPNFLIIHCHDEKRDFERIRVLTKEIKSKLSSSIIFIDHDEVIKKGYYKTNIRRYDADSVMTTHGGEFDVVEWLQIIEDFMAKKK